MIHYYETATRGEIQAHETLEDAIQFANENGCTLITEIGIFEDWEKCSFCGDWFPSVELDEKATCSRCLTAIKHHNTK